MDGIVVLLSACSIMCYTLQCFFNKLYSVAYPGGAPEANSVFSLLYGLIVGVFTLAVNGFTFQAGALTWTLGLINGFVLFMFNLSGINAAQRGPYSFQSVMMLFGSVLLALLFSVVYWGERLKGTQLIGIAVMLAAFVLLNMKGLSLSGAKKGYLPWVAVLFFSNGIYGILMDAQQRVNRQAERNEMIIVTFLCSAAVSLVYLLVTQKSRSLGSFRMGRKAWSFALISSTGAAVAVYTMMLLLGRVSFSVLYTVQNGGIMVILAILSALVLKEKLSRGSVAGIALAVISIVLLGL